MNKLVCGMATSHAFALQDPGAWEAGVGRNRKIFEKLYGYTPPLHGRAATETIEQNEKRYSAIRSAHEFLREKLRAARLDALVIIGDDQNENFTEENLPALAIYVGGEFQCQGDRVERGPYQRYSCASDLAWHLLVHCVENGFDVSKVEKFPDDRLKAHAFGPVLNKLVVPMDTPIIPVFVEAIHYPAPTPARCYEFGKALRGAIEAWSKNVRVGFCASGGLSHFSAGYPYAHFDGRDGLHYGSIDEQFDRSLLEAMTQGNAEPFRALTNRDLLEHGEIELRSWITGLGMVHDGAAAQVLAYEPFYSAIMGMGVAYWEL